MKTPLYIVVDTSGSMNEMGKIHTQRNLCRCAAQLKLIDQVEFSDINIYFFQWSTEITEVIIHNDANIPVLTPIGSSDLSCLLDFLSAQQCTGQKLRALIFSDGNFSKSDISRLQNRLKTYPDILLRTVAIGADADLLKLKKISTNEHVYLAENIHTAIRSACFGIDGDVIVPDSASQIKLIRPTKPEEEWDA